jgi:hypothetical protein
MRGMFGRGAGRRRWALLVCALAGGLAVVPGATGQLDGLNTTDLCVDLGSALTEAGTIYYDPGGGCVWNWEVDPPYTGDYYADEAAADAAEPPPPVIVASALPTWRNLYDWPAGHGYVGWRATSSSDALYGAQSALGGQHGLWLWPRGGQQSYTESAYAEWSYTAPGTTRISNVSLSFAYRNKLLAHHCLDVGLRNAVGAVVFHNEHCKPVQPPDSQRDVAVTLADPSSVPTSRTLYVRIRVDCGGASTCAKTIAQLDPLATGGYARLLRVDMTLVDDDLPVVTPSGPFFDKRYDYINGRSVYALTTSASDAGSGVARAWVERIGAGEILWSAAPCDPTHHTPALDTRICPETFSFTGNVDTTTLPEGAHTFVEKARDVAANVGASETWPVYVDRTPPTAATNFRLQFFDPATGEYSIDWDDLRDPPLADGTPGSGVAREEFHYRVGAGAWSTWLDVDDEAFDLTGGIDGSVISIEVRSWDGVGNGPSVGAGQVTLIPKAFVPPPDLGIPEQIPPGTPSPADAPDWAFEEDTSPGEFPLTEASARTQLDITAPGYTYRRAAARAYARKWVGTYRWPGPGTSVDWSRDDGYNLAQYRTQRRGTAGEDCANFVSQALHAGGMTFTSPISFATAADGRSWWADKDLVGGEGVNGASYPWINATGFITFMRDRSRRVQQLFPKRRNEDERIARHPLRNLSAEDKAKIKIGDVIQLDLFDDNQYYPSHTTIVTKTPADGGQFAVTYHTNNRLNFPLWRLLRDYRPEYVWILHVRNSWTGRTIP